MYYKKKYGIGNHLIYTNIETIFYSKIQNMMQYIYSLIILYQYLI